MRGWMGDVSSRAQRGICFPGLELGPARSLPSLVVTCSSRGLPHAGAPLFLPVSAPAAFSGVLGESGSIPAHGLKRLGHLHGSGAPELVAYRLADLHPIAREVKREASHRQPTHRLQSADVHAALERVPVGLALKRVAVAAARLHVERGNATV